MKSLKLRIANVGLEKLYKLDLTLHVAFIYVTLLDVAIGLCFYFFKDNSQHLMLVGKRFAVVYLYLCLRFAFDLLSKPSETWFKALLVKSRKYLLVKYRKTFLKINGDNDRYDSINVQ